MSRQTIKKTLKLKERSRDQDNNTTMPKSSISKPKETTNKVLGSSTTVSSSIKHSNPSNAASSSSRTENPSKVSTSSLTSKKNIVNSVNQTKNLKTKTDFSPYDVVTHKTKVPATRPTAKPLTTTRRTTPMKAIIATKPTVHQQQPSIAVAPNNVMNTIHNVTVLSPPSIRRSSREYAIPDDRELKPEQIEINKFEVINKKHFEENERSRREENDKERHQRSRTRTLKPNEVLVLSKPEVIAKAIQIKDPVAFQIDFSNKTTQDKTIGSHQQISNLNKTVGEINKTNYSSKLKEPETHNTIVPIPTATIQQINTNELVSDNEDEYEDDFDSYESDFESYSSSSSRSNETMSNKFADIVHETTHREQDFDSGLYDIKQQDSSATALAADVAESSVVVVEQHSHQIHVEDDEAQIDSGFGYTTMSPIPKAKSDQIVPTAASAASSSLKRLYYYKRSMELMSKITLDTMSFSLFELKPIPYEYYMKMFGHVNSTQMSTQTGYCGNDQDCQTDAKQLVTMWTQWPPEFNVNNMQQSRFIEDRNGCGMDLGDGSTNIHEIFEIDIEQSLAEMRKISLVSNHVASVHGNHHIDVDYDELSWFLQKSSITVSSIFNAQLEERALFRSDDAIRLPESEGYFTIDWKGQLKLQHMKIVSILSDSVDSNVIYSVHTSEDSGVSECLLAIWNSCQATKPTQILSCWSRVVCIETLANVVFAGLSDGTIALWNLMEPVRLHHYNDTNSFTIPCHIVQPMISSENVFLYDFGQVMAVKAIDRIQICSLHRDGLLTAWSLLCADDYHHHTATSKANRIDHSSPWATIKLVQTNVIDLRKQYICATLPGRPSSSAFEQTRAYFESNIFSDAALQELQRIHASGDQVPVKPPQKCNPIQLQCLDLAIMNNSLFVATNQNFLFIVAKQFHSETRVRSIRVSDNSIYATRIATFVNGREALLVGMSNGSVKLIWCKIGHHDISGPFSPRKGRPSDDVDVDDANNWNFGAKSCAIQNIILEERRGSADAANDGANELSVNIDGFESVNDNDDDDPLRYWNQFYLCHGLSLDRQLVRWMHHSVRQDRIFALCGNSLRQFDVGGMVENNDGSDIIVNDATLIHSANQREYLVLLINDEIRVHVIRRSS